MSEMHLRTLFVSTAGTRLLLDGHAVKALREGEPPRRLPLEAIDSLIVCSGVDVSTPLLITCAEEGRVVAFLSGSGRPRAVVEGMADGRSELRRLQYAAHALPERRDAMAAVIVEGKVRQMAWATRQWARDSESQTRDQLRVIADELDDAAASAGGLSRESLLGIEGSATRRYYAGMGRVLGEPSWPGRRRRPPPDPINAMLSWLYGMTRVAVQGAIMVSGLDPGTGFLHGDRPGQPSLALDLMEELRPPAERLAVMLWRTKRLQSEHFERRLGSAVELGDEGRRILFDAWHQHRATEVLVRGRAGQVSNGFIPIMQAHEMANALRQSRLYRAHARRVR